MKFETAFIITKFAENLIKNTRRNIKSNFKEVYLTHNLVDTMSLERTGRPYSWDMAGIDSGADFLNKERELYVLHIPAIRYDLKAWENEGVVIHTPEEGSYAWEVDLSGGFSPKKVHLGYIESAIIESIRPSFNGAKYGFGKKFKIKITGVNICR